MSTPLISVIIPAYNHEQYIKETINSIINQTYQNIELIVIDDGSKDSTWTKIQEMEKECKKRFSNIVFKTKENEGSCTTLNKLLNLSNGEYIYLIASDDVAKPQAIELEYNFLSNNPEFSLCVGNNELIDSDSKICYWDKNRNIIYNKSQATFLTFVDFLKHRRKINFNSEEFGRYDNLYLGNHVPNGYLIRKSIFDKIGYYTKEAPLEDWWQNLQISKYAKMKYLNEILFSYRWHATNTIKQNNRMEEYANKTREYEEQLLSKLNLNTVFPIVKNVYMKGVCYKKTGIPFIFEKLTYRKGNKKNKKYKIFNITIN